jgi:hypothetical protein
VRASIRACHDNLQPFADLVLRYMESTGEARWAEHIRGMLADERTNAGDLIIHDWRGRRYGQATTLTALVQCAYGVWYALPAFTLAFRVDAS